MINSRQKSLGFTLLEAMVAVVVMTMGLFATYSWINVNIQSLIRAEQVVDQEILIEELIEELLLTDFSEVDSGEVQSGFQSVRWSAGMVEKRSGVNARGIVGLYDHRLYEIRIDVYSNGVQVGEHFVRLVNSEQVREPNLPL
ncbi:MAG: prepilin-type N-terminal cleavage/methylation domain-containing protein [Pseudomonadales bacterium]|nr:prepilin-type N-terminal cleavage/methylation domain-containing protein [Pseudomonadales bacterium]MBO6596140.1 prepilin-type N-terminal cleavage/methylation domain-containing protein [Pseudomonadales bacterium]MBO6822620.1 prepilin-type N-terminal cleavage/methylation domain-containing protein [Pseudomonadales bacterium]